MNQSNTERVHGQWIKQNPMVDTEECSVCGYNILDEELETPFCPWCGSDMRGEDNMDDVIYRQDAINAFQDYANYDSNRSNAEWVERIELVISRLPSAQKKGHWRNYEGTLTCSVCETEFDNGIMEYCGDDVPMFCPDCGADMRGEDDG